MRDKFSDDLDAYIDGIDMEDEYDGLLQLGKALADKDFSKNSHKKEVFNKTLENIKKYKGDDTMNNTRKTKKPIMKVASFALVCILGFSMIKTSFAQNLVDKIVRTITLGHITVIEEEHDERESFPIPEQFKGKIFDKEGNPIEVFLADKPQKIYTADGEEIAYLDPENGDVITVAEAERELEDTTLVVKDTAKLNDYTCFDIILPSYLPKGYKFDRAGFFKNENGVVEENSKYVELFFTNDETGEFIYMQQRFADEETAYATGAAKVEEIKINGVDALLYGDNLDWEYNGIIYMLNGRGIPKDELIKMAESFK